MSSDESVEAGKCRHDEAPNGPEQLQIEQARNIDAVMPDDGVNTEATEGTKSNNTAAAKWLNQCAKS